MKIILCPPYKSEGKPLDIGNVIFGLRWLHFENYIMPIGGRLITVDGVFEWHDRRYSFRWGLGQFGIRKKSWEIFFNGPYVVRENKLII